MSDAPKRDWWAPAILTLIVTVGFFGALFWLVQHGLPEDGRDAILIMIGALCTAWTGCVAYYVGSTAGSARKTDALERIAGSSSNQP